MRGTSRSSLAAVAGRWEPVAVAAGADALTLADELFAFVDALDSSGSLRRILADPSAEPDAKAGVVSRPFRSPGAPGQHPAWEILKVEEKVESQQPADSESVRYVASRAIARQKAVQEYRDTLAQVRAQADIRLNPAVLSPAGDRKEVQP